MICTRGEGPGTAKGCDFSNVRKPGNGAAGFWLRATGPYASRIHLA